MIDQYNGAIRDSEIKCECRMLLSAVLNLVDPKAQKVFTDSIYRIAKLENERLDRLRKEKS